VSDNHDKTEQIANELLQGQGQGQGHIAKDCPDYGEVQNFRHHSGETPNDTRNLTSLIELHCGLSNGAPSNRNEYGDVLYPSTP
jgi:hypothetical protein